MRIWQAAKWGFRVQSSQNGSFRNTNFVDKMIANILRDSGFSRNQPHKSGGNQYIEIVKLDLGNL